MGTYESATRIPSHLDAIDEVAHQVAPENGDTRGNVVSCVDPSGAWIAVSRVRARRGEEPLWAELTVQDDNGLQACYTQLSATEAQVSFSDERLPWMSGPDVLRVLVKYLSQLRVVVEQHRDRVVVGAALPQPEQHYDNAA